MSTPVLGWHTAQPNTCGWCGHPINWQNTPTHECTPKETNRA